MTTIIKCCIDKKYIKIPLKILDSQTKITLIEAIKKDLVFRLNPINLFSNYKFNNNEKIIKLYEYDEDNEIIFIPKFTVLSNITFKFVKDIRDKNNENIEIIFNGKLNNQQLETVNNTENQLLNNYNILYSLPCGFGKTVLSIYWICRLKLQTFILVHKYDLLNQWIQRLKDFTNIKEDDIYCIGSTKQNRNDKNKKYKIYIGMIQTIMRDDFDDEEIPDTIGLLICDECHHLGAECFCKGLKKIPSKYYISLSATPNRKDGNDKIYQSYTGYNIYKQERLFNDPVSIKICKYSFDSDKMKKYEKIFNGFNRSKIINILSEDQERNKKILDLIFELIKNNRKILVLSDRINQLDLFYEVLKDNNVNRSYGKYREDINNCEILLATYSMAAEGLDVKQMDTLIMATPRNNIIQCCGRIMREENNRERIIYDIIDNDINDYTFYVKLKYYKTISKSITEINF